MGAVLLHRLSDTADRVLSAVRPGQFITLEGIEGAGKSSGIPFIRERLEAAGQAVEITREPGGTPLAEALRGILLDDWGEGVPPLTELLIVFAARAAHLQNKILPSLEAGSWVVSDRFTDATYAYQGAGRGLGEHRVSVLESMVQNSFRPDHVLVFDVPVEIGLARVRDRRQDDNRFDREVADFMEAVRRCYRERAAAEPERYTLIDAAVPINRVHQQIDAVLRRMLSG